MVALTTVALISRCPDARGIPARLHRWQSGHVQDRLKTIRKQNGMLFTTQSPRDALEEVTQVAIGNTIAGEVAPAGNLLFIKPREQHPFNEYSGRHATQGRREAQLSIEARAIGIIRSVRASISQLDYCGAQKLGGLIVPCKKLGRRKSD